MKPHDVILLLQEWTRRHFVVELTDTELIPGAVATTTDLVHHISEIDCTTNVCLDSMTVVPHVPPGNTVVVGKGRLQWFETIIELDAPMESPTLPSFSTSDCDPYIADTTRWSLLCIKVDQVTGDYTLFWVHAKPGMGYPEIPYNGVPLALVKTRPGLIVLTKEDISNWRCIRPGYAPAAKFWFEPVADKNDLFKYVDPPEGASCLVINDGVNYYYKNGAWRKMGAPTFDNTAYYVDIDVITNRVDLPWPVSSATELAVFRDGMLMTYERDYYVYTGQTPYLIFTYNLMPGQRVSVIRNPFFAQTTSLDVTLNSNQIYDIYVDGISGSDAFDGSAVNPYKTLQHAFDVIPTFSNHVFRVHATNLLRVDMVASPDGTVQRCYGYMIGKRMRSLRLYIDDNYEWFEPQDEYVAYLNTVNFVEFIGSSITYHILLLCCTSALTNTSLDAGQNGTPRVIFEGGITALNSITQNDDTFEFICRGNCIAKVDRGTYKKLTIQSSGYVIMNYGTINELTMDSNGIFQATNTILTDTVKAVDSLLYLHSCVATLTAGDFSGGYLQAENMNFPVYLPDTLRRRFFYGHHGASFALTNINIDRTPFSSIYMTGNCTLAMIGGVITRSTEYGVEIDHSSVAVLSGVDFSSNIKSAVFGNYHCSISFINCTGYNNYRYGCECDNISRASFENTSTVGILGQYYELLPGADTVLADRNYDRIPGTLEQKITTGQGLTHQIAPNLNGNISDFQYKIVIDLDELVGTGGSYGAPLLDLMPKVSVYEHLNQILPSGPLATVYFPFTWPGTSYISSVTRRVFDPSVQTKQVDINLTSREWFVEEDPWNGTTMLSDGITLVDFPLGVGYKPNSPHFFFTEYLSSATLSNYGVSSITGFNIDADVPTGTRLQVAFSVHGSTAWRYWNATTMQWDLLPGTSTLIQMQSAPDWDDVIALPASALDALRQLNMRYITVCFLLSTTSSVLTPKVRSFTWNYIEDGFLEDITHTFHRQYYSNRATFEYDGSLGPIDPPVYFSVMPAVNRV